MKKLFAVLLCFTMIIPITACSSDKKEDTSTKNKEIKKDNFTKAGRAKAKDIVEQFKENNSNIDYYINFDESNDLNNKPTYIGKVSFNDKSISGDYDPKDPTSGTIEVFKSNEEAIKRADYLADLDSFLDIYGNHIIFENILVRLNKLYTKTDIDKFAKILNVEVYRYKDTNENKDTETTNEEPTAEAPTTETPKEETPVTNPSPTPAPAEPSAPSTPNVNMENSNALNSAKRYLAVMPFSYSGLVNQLIYEQYSSDAATYAANNCGADWNAQAAKKAQSYINFMSFSRQGLIDQLLYDGFTQDQAVYGVTSVGY